MSNATVGQAIVFGGNTPLLLRLIRELLRFGVDDVLVLDNDPSMPIPALARELPKAAKIVWLPRLEGVGTGGALYNARVHLQDRFLFCSGASARDFNYAQLLSHAAAHPGHNHIVLEGETEALDVITQWPHQELADAGIGLLGRTILPLLLPVCSLQTDVLPALAAKGHLLATIAKKPILPLQSSRPALFLDRDGTINRDHGYVGTRDRWEWIDGALEAIHFATQAGWHVFVVTNQSGIARNMYDEAALEALHAWMTNEVRRTGGTIDDIRFCPFHEKAVLPQYRQASQWRKPAPGMVLDLVERWGLDTTRCVLVGDQPSDMAAATAAGVKGQLFDGVNLLETIKPLLAG